MSEGKMVTKKRLAEWIVETCLLFGTTTETAYKVAAVFIEGLEE